MRFAAEMTIGQWGKQLLVRGGLSRYTQLMSGSRRQSIVVFGSSGPVAGSGGYELAHELGEAIAGAGYDLVNGGYGGTMAGAAEGARKGGGKTTGVTCDAFRRSEPNSFIDNEIRTRDLYERLRRLVELGDAYVVLPGGTGTLVELALVWELANKRFLTNRPIICLADYWRKVVETIVESGEKMRMTVHFAESVCEVMRMLKEQLK